MSFRWISVPSFSFIQKVPSVEDIALIHSIHIGRGKPVEKLHLFFSSEVFPVNDLCIEFPTIC